LALICGVIGAQIAAKVAVGAQTEILAVLGGGLSVDS
jgi:hypothetical protein